MKISNLISDWYKINGRDLPWRRNRNPYSVWISEIILQQTRVSQGMDYYHRFMKKFPDIKKLAETEINEVLNVWQGLGYYSRARNLHNAAKEVVRNYNGKFPSTYSEIIKLRGIGSYTAGAIASICFGEKVPAIDGNALRLISRMFLIGEDISKISSQKKIHSIVSELIKKGDPAIINQAIMDLGAMICTPRNPSCDECPLEWKCEAKARGVQHILPVKKKKTRVSLRYFHYLVMGSENTYFLEKRNSDDIWRWLYQFPLIETKKEIKDEDIHSLISSFLNTEEFNIHKISKTYTHILSHQKILAKFYHISHNDELEKTRKEGLIKVTEENFEQYPLPKLIENYVKDSLD